MDYEGNNGSMNSVIRAVVNEAPGDPPVLFITVYRE